MDGPLLVDNDVLIKTAHWGLLDYIPACASTTWSRVAVLDSLHYRSRRHDRKLFLTPEVADRLSERLRSTMQTPPPDPRIIHELQGRPDLDAGEVQLIASAIATQGSVLMTGDKRALRALSAPGLANLTRPLRGRVLCLEHVIKHALQQLGAVALAETIEPYRGLDTAIRVSVPAVAYSDGAEHRINNALDVYLCELERVTEGLISAT